MILHEHLLDCKVRLFAAPIIRQEGISRANGDGIEDMWKAQHAHCVHGKRDEMVVSHFVYSNFTYFTSPW